MLEQTIRNKTTAIDLTDSDLQQKVQRKEKVLIFIITFSQPTSNDHTSLMPEK